MESIVPSPGHHHFPPKRCTKQKYLCPGLRLVWRIWMLDLIRLWLSLTSSAYLRAAKHSNLYPSITSNTWFHVTGIVRRTAILVLGHSGRAELYLQRRNLYRINSFGNDYRFDAITDLGWGQCGMGNGMRQTDLHNSNLKQSSPQLFVMARILICRRQMVAAGRYTLEGVQGIGLRLEAGGVRRMIW